MSVNVSSIIKRPIMSSNSSMTDTISHSNGQNYYFEQQEMHTMEEKIIKNSLSILRDPEKKAKIWFESGMSVEYVRRFGPKLPNNWIKFIRDSDGQIGVEIQNYSNVTKTFVALPVSKKRISKVSTNGSPNNENAVHFTTDESNNTVIKKDSMLTNVMRSETNSINMFKAEQNMKNETKRETIAQNVAKPESEKLELSQREDFESQQKACNDEYRHQLGNELKQQKSVICIHEENIKQNNRFKENNKELKKIVLNLNSVLNEKDEENKCLNKKLRNQLRNSLASNRIEINRLNDLIGDKEKYYETKIENMDKEWNQKMRKCLDENNEQFIEMKDEYERQLSGLKKENKELKDKYWRLRLESDARQMSAKFVDPIKSTKKSSTDLKRRSTNENGLNQVLDSDQSKVELIAPKGKKRKKLLKTTDPYLDSFNDDFEN